MRAPTASRRSGVYAIRASGSRLSEGATEPTSEDVEYQTLTLTRGFDRTTAVKARGSKSTRREPERCRHVHQPQLQRSLYSARILAGHYVRSLRLQL